MSGLKRVCGRADWPGWVSVLAALLWLAGAGSSPGAEMYKWVDKDGHVQYTQEPPPGDIKAETVKPPPKVDSESAQKETEQLEKQLGDAREGRQKEAEESNKAADDKAFNEENCRRAKVSLASYQVPNALVQQPDGSRVRLAEEERLAGLQKSAELIKKYCKE